jgi:hypothetical protein
VQTGQGPRPFDDRLQFLNHIVRVHNGPGSEERPALVFAQDKSKRLGLLGQS